MSTETGFVELENVTGNEQKVYDDNGQIHFILPYSSKLLRPSIAEQFKRERGGWVQKALPTSLPPLRPGETPMWIANVTGSPFIPKTFKNKVVKREKTAAGVVTTEIDEEIPNQAAVAATLKWSLDVGQGLDPYGRFQPVPGQRSDFNVLPYPMSLKPRTRRIVSTLVGRWILEQDTIGGPEMSGKVIECREPTSFEPTMQWPLNHILFYAQMVDEPGFSNKIAAEIVKECDKDSATRASVLAISQVMADPELHEVVKDKLLDRLFYRLVDRRFALPTQKAFEIAFENAKKSAHDDKRKAA